MGVDISTARIDFNDEPAILGVAIDITDRKEATFTKGRLVKKRL